MNAMHADDEILAAARSGFMDEALDTLRQLELGLLRMEQDPGDREAVHEAFRAAHTLKGAAGMFGLDALVRLTHTLEGTLDALQLLALLVQRARFTPHITDFLGHRVHHTARVLLGLGADVLLAGLRVHVVAPGALHHGVQRRLHLVHLAGNAHAGLPGLGRELPHLLRDHRETAAALAGPCGFDGGVQRQQVGSAADGLYFAGECAQLLQRLGQGARAVERVVAQAGG
jgi:HPt (histidine-containing phosphotransfer) domain-containing protein